MAKFNRYYELVVETLLGHDLIFNPPFTLDFDITRTLQTSANTATIRIYNLAPLTRDQIFQDIYETAAKKRIILNCGYGEPGLQTPLTLSTVFNGIIQSAYSYRQGVNMITEITAEGGVNGFLNGKIDMTFPPGTPQSAMFKAMLAFIPDVKQGVVGLFETSDTFRASVAEGNVIDVLQELSGGALFIDNNKAHILKDDEQLLGDLQVINSQSGLLGTPKRSQTHINFEILFEPRLMLGQLLRLESLTEKKFNGLGKVISLSHRGTISGAIGGSATTSVGMFFAPPKPVGKG